MPYNYDYDEAGLEDKIEDYIYQLMERFKHDKAKIRAFVENMLDNYEVFK